jgi:hypothetical protein
LATSGPPLPRAGGLEQIQLSDAGESR